MGKRNQTVGSLILFVAELAVGILLLIDPVGFTSGILIVLGVILAVFGVGSLVQYFRASPEDAALKSGLARGILLLLLGLFLMFRSQWFIVTFPLLTAVYGIATLITGIGKIQWAVDMIRVRQKFWFIALLSALLTILFAIFILANPFTTTAILWTFIAVALIVEAAADIVTFVVRQVGARRN